MMDLFTYFEPIVLGTCSRDSKPWQAFGRMANGIVLFILGGGIQIVPWITHSFGPPWSIACQRSPDLNVSTWKLENVYENQPWTRPHAQQDQSWNATHLHFICKTKRDDKKSNGPTDRQGFYLPSQSSQMVHQSFFPGFSTPSSDV